ncbi:cobalamin-dependent protein [Xanthobacter sp. V3C-3]|uniref:cobalamin B12-binding domain-containing protein n=1 Tax=Xanthobacter lutulentifluminis TaxID=3119935 RepID=UPI003726D7A7
MIGAGMRPLRVLVTKIGLDGHDRGSRIVAAYLRDAGMEVIYTPPWQTIPGVVKLATEEDVDVIGISSLATDHLIVPKMMEELRAAGLAHVGVVVGGIVPEAEQPALAAAGVSRVFGPGAGRDEIVECVTLLGQKSRAQRADTYSEVNS